MSFLFYQARIYERYPLDSKTSQTDELDGLFAGLLTVTGADISLVLP